MILLAGTKPGGTYQYLTFEQVRGLRFFNITDEDGNNVARFKPNSNDDPQLRDDTISKQDEPIRKWKYCHSNLDQQIQTDSIFVLYQLRESIIWAGGRCAVTDQRIADLLDGTRRRSAIQRL